MKWNPFNLVEPAINKTKSLLFPINPKLWMKLGFVSLFSIYGRGMGGGGGSPGGNVSNFSIPYNQTSPVTGNAVSSFAKNSIIGGIIGIFLVIFAVIALVINYITSMFTFVFIDSLIKKDCSIKRSWNNGGSFGMSLFLFRILFAVVNLIIIGLIALTPILKIFSKGGFGKFFESTPILGIIFTFLPYLLLFILWIIIISIFMTFVIDFSLLHIYKNSIGISSSIKQTFKAVFSQMLESFVYLVAKLVLRIGVGLISIFAFILLIIVAAIPGFVIGVLLFLILFFISKILAIGVVILFGIVYLVLFIYVFVVLILPLTIFMSYFSMLCYEKLLNVKLVK